jgi:hypothetical protein
MPALLRGVGVADQRVDVGTGLSALIDILADPFAM